LPESIDPRNGDRTVLANLSPGLDNATFVGKPIRWSGS
jgi:hypothetical protein